MLFNLHHRGVKLILAYSWARPAILVAGKGRGGGVGGMFLFLLFFYFHSCSSFFPVPLFHVLYCLFSLFSPFFWETTQNDPQGFMCCKPLHNQYWDRYAFSNSVDSDQKMQNIESDQVVHCLQYTQQYFRHIKT